MELCSGGKTVSFMIPEQHSCHQMPYWMQDFTVIELLC